MFGTLGQNLLPFRDANDLVMSQVSVDIWTSFARTFNPNPSTEYLNARGYSNTTAAFKIAGEWKPVTPSEKTPLRLLDVPMSNSAFVEEAQCALLQFPFSLFE